MRYWEIIADNLSKAGWSWGCLSAVDRDGRTIWIADAHRDDGKRFVVRAGEKLTAFIELESAVRAFVANWFDRLARFFANSASLHGSESGGGLFPRWVLRLFQTCNRRINTASKQKGNILMPPVIQLKRATSIFLVGLTCFGRLPASIARGA
jgi:hypothetical protein